MKSRSRSTLATPDTHRDDFLRRGRSNFAPSQPVSRAYQCLVQLKDRRPRLGIRTLAFRLYFDPRNDIDIYRKRQRLLQLKLYASPDYPYHEESPGGRDIFRVGESFGIGAVAAWVDGKVVKAANVRERKWHIVSTGPVRTIVELKYGGWNLGPESITLRSRIVQWAGEHDFYHTITVVPPFSGEFVTGFPVKHDVALMKSIPDDQDNVAWLATWGEQVVAPGATATEAVPGQNPGLAVLTNTQSVEFADDHNQLSAQVPAP
jgi:hypothetical protein